MVPERTSREHIIGKGGRPCCRLTLKRLGLAARQKHSTKTHPAVFGTGTSNDQSFTRLFGCHFYEWRVFRHFQEGLGFCFNDLRPFVQFQ